MTTIEIADNLSKSKFKMLLGVIEAMGISFKTNEHNETQLSKEEFLNKIEKARKGNKTKVSKENQSKMLGI